MSVKDLMMGILGKKSPKTSRKLNEDSEGEPIQKSLTDVTTHDEYMDLIKQSYDIDEDGTIRSPGKFEAEPYYAPYYWEVLLDGAASEEWERVARIDLGEKDHELFPELEGDNYLYIETSDQGFTGVTSMPDKHEDEGKWNEEDNNGDPDEGEDSESPEHEEGETPTEEKLEDEMESKNPRPGRHLRELSKDLPAKEAEGEVKPPVVKTKRELLEEALRDEEGGVTFYKEAANICDDADVKKMFLSHAKDEQAHADEIKKFLSKETKGDEKPETEVKDHPVPKQESHIPKFRSSEELGYVKMWQDRGLWYIEVAGGERAGPFKSQGDAEHSGRIIANDMGAKGRVEFDVISPQDESRQVKGDVRQKELIADPEVSGDTWWNSGGHELWKRFGGEVGVGSITLSDKDSKKFLTLASQIDGWEENPIMVVAKESRLASMHRMKEKVDRKYRR